MRKGMLGVAGVVLGAALVAAPAASPGEAKRGEVRVAGVCTKSSTSKLKLSEENGRIEIEFEVDQNRNGVRWTVVLNRNGSRIARLVRTTKAPSGSVEARVLARDLPGTDIVTARATNSLRETRSARAAFG